MDSPSQRQTLERHISRNPGAVAADSYTGKSMSGGEDINVPRNGKHAAASVSSEGNVQDLASVLQTLQDAGRALEVAKREEAAIRQSMQVWHITSDLLLPAVLPF